MRAPIIALIDIGHRRGDAALGHPSVRLAKQRFANNAHGCALCERFDRRAQPGATCADDQNVVLIGLVLFHQVVKGAKKSKASARGIENTWKKLSPSWAFKLFSQEVAGKSADRRVFPPRPRAQGPNNIGVDFNFIVTAAELCNCVYSSKGLRIISGVMGIPELGRFFVTAKLFRDWINLVFAPCSMSFLLDSVHEPRLVKRT